MNDQKRWIRIVTLLMLVSIWAVSPSRAQDEDCLSFDVTGHRVCGEFRTFFETRGDLEIFGYPLTEAFNDPTRGLMVQYFQRARMELHPYNPEPYRVQLGLLVDELADELGYNFPPATEIPPFNTALRRYFPETGHTVMYDFLEYFDTHGGIDIFGYPRSEIMYEDGYVVQYFQRMRMEWHPEVRSGSRMRLTNLGEIYLDRFNIPVEFREQSRIGNIIQLYVTASVRNVITGQWGEQTVFVYVTNQWKQPVAGSAVQLIIHYPDHDQSYDLPQTDETGFSRYDFELQPSVPGQKVVIDVQATHGSLSAQTQTFFLPWW